MNDPLKTHGAVSWTELLTSDPEQSKAFYAAVFGWRFEQMPMENDEPYFSIHVGEQAIGGIMHTPAEAGNQPPMWGGYVTVDDLDHTLATARSEGGQVLQGPMDVPDVGRCALLQDPQGARIHAIEYLS